MEEISRTHKSKTDLKSLRDVSPSIAMLCDRAQEDAALWKNPGIRAYVNGRLQNGIKGALYRGEFDNARRLAEFMLTPLTGKQRLYQLGVQLPADLLRGAIAGFQSLLNLRRG